MVRVCGLKLKVYREMWVIWGSGLEVWVEGCAKSPCRERTTGKTLPTGDPQ